MLDECAEQCDSLVERFLPADSLAAWGILDRGECARRDVGCVRGPVRVGWVQNLGSATQGQDLRVVPAAEHRAGDPHQLAAADGSHLERGALDAMLSGVALSFLATGQPAARGDVHSIRKRKVFLTGGLGRAGPCERQRLAYQVQHPVVDAENGELRHSVQVRATIYPRITPPLLDDWHFCPVDGHRTDLCRYSRILAPAGAALRFATILRLTLNLAELSEMTCEVSKIGIL